MEMKCFTFFVLTLLWRWTYSESCITPFGVQSECINLYECPAILPAFSQNPLSSEIVNFLRQSQCGFDGNTPKVCCGPYLSENVPTTTTTQQPIRQVSNFNGYVDPVSTEDSYPAPSDECGIDTNGNRIFGGNVTDLDEFPWMVLLGYKTRNGSIGYHCGGVLINHRYVITAAHCITGAVEREIGKLVTVRLGEYNTQTSIDCVDDECADPPQDIPVQYAYPHPTYEDGNKNRHGDIGILRLASRAKYTYYVQPICLPDHNIRLAPSTNVYVAGWGKTLSGRNSPIKLKLRIPISQKSECVSKYRSLGAELSENQICAGGIFAEDACRGDSGGPLMRAKTEGVWESVGVVSFGYGCGRQGWPGVYTSVVGYLDWILSMMSSTNV